MRSGRARPRAASPPLTVLFPKHERLKVRTTAAWAPFPVPCVFAQIRAPDAGSHRLFHRRSRELILPTRPRLAPDRAPTGGRPGRSTPTARRRILAPQPRSTSIRPLDVRAASLRRTVVQEFVHEALAASAAVHQQVFQLGQASQVHLTACRPTGALAHLAAAEAEVCARHLLRAALALDHLADEAEEAPRLRRQLIERAAQHLVREPLASAMSSSVTSMYSIDCAAVRRRLHLALVLVQQRDRLDQRQVLLVIAPRARAVIEEGQPLGVRIHDRQAAAAAAARCGGACRIASRSLRAIRPASVRRSRCRLDRLRSARGSR